MKTLEEIKQCKRLIVDQVGMDGGNGIMGGRMRMKKIIAIILLSVLLVGCKKIETVKGQVDDQSMFVEIEQTSLFSIMYHRKTKVMYAVSCVPYNAGNFTLLVNPDGSPMIYEEGGEIE